MTAFPDECTPATNRKVFVQQMIFFAAALSLVALNNAITVLSDRAEEHLSWRPFVWEFSSILCLWLLIPPLGRLLRRFPLSRGRWLRSIPVHLIATVPYSLLHVAGMTLLRQAIYGLAGMSYHFGPWLDNWLYEYHKDFVSYWLILAGLLAFHTYGLWLDSREHIATPPATPAEGIALERIVLRRLNREFIVNTADIDRIEADGNCVRVHVQGAAYPLRESLTALERKLDSRCFVRVHRGHIVNIDRISEIQPWDHGDYRILLKDGSFVNFSRRYRGRLGHLFN